MRKKQIKILSPTAFKDEFMNRKSYFPTMIQKPVQIFNIGQTVGYIRVPTPLYRQDYNSLIIITKGEAKQQVESETFTINVNDILFIKQGNITALKDVKAGTEGYIVLFPDDFLNKLFSEEKLISIFNINPVVHLSTEIVNWLKPLYQLLEIENGIETSPFDISKSLFQVIFFKIIASSDAADAKINKAGELTFKFKSYVYKNYINHRSVGYYAGKLAVSENYLNRCIKQSTQMSPKELINKIVILESQLLLQDLTKSVSEVAFKLEFEDPSYFGRLFKKVTGITPTNYRLSLINKK